MRLLAPRVNPVTVTPVTARALVIPFTAPSPPIAEHAANAIQSAAQGKRDTIMFDELWPHVEILAASVLGACFAVAVIVSSVM